MLHYHYYATKVIITFLSLILTLNNFVFNCTHNLQIMGCVMGIICYSSYANIFMANYEAKHIYPCIKEMSLLYLRYMTNVYDMERHKGRVNDIHERTK